MASVETSKRSNPEGLYRHSETGKEVVIKNHPKFGSAMADGFVAVGYQFVGPAEIAPAKKETKKEEAK